MEHTGAIREDDQTLVKFHGIYMQDDRDRRKNVLRKKLERFVFVTIRLRLPGRFVYRAKLGSAASYRRRAFNRCYKITTRQTVQLHGVLKNHVKPMIAGFNKEHLDSIAACGDSKQEFYLQCAS